MTVLVGLLAAESCIEFDPFVREAVAEGSKLLIPTLQRLMGLVTLIELPVVNAARLFAYTVFVSVLIICFIATT
jgi:hypothetical protein